ncbi:hypothetical protein B2I21_18135 [Chryseobacterium mucoviscidosis]|nr:hypothetical protein B2I21_18135 [Chryseobacterium mucoviscidosis]
MSGFINLSLVATRPLHLFIINQQEEHYLTNQKYRLMSLLCIIMFDLGLVMIEEDIIKSKEKSFDFFYVLII